MNVQEGVAAINKMRIQSEEAAQTAQNVSAKYEAHMTLHNVACRTGDDKEAELQRGILHDLVEQLLDCGMTVGRNQREMAHIVNTVHD